MISIIIPIYRKCHLVPELVESIKNQDIKKEIILVVDCPTKKTRKSLDKIKGVKILYSGKRRGKFKSCNLGAEKAKSDKLIFLDSDVILGKNVLQSISKALEKAHIVEVRKEIVRDSFAGKMTYAEYVLNYFTIDLVSKNTKYGLINGAAFGVRKKVFEKAGGMENCLVEDTEFSIRASRNKKFCFLKNVKVKTKIKKTFRELWEQRKRWILGAIETFRKHPKAAKEITGFSPAMTLLWLLVSLPFLFWFPLVIYPMYFPFFTAGLFLVCFSIYSSVGKSLDYDIHVEDYLFYFFLGSGIRVMLLVYGTIIMEFFPDKIKQIDSGWVR